MRSVQIKFFYCSVYNPVISTCWFQIKHPTNRSNTPRHAYRCFIFFLCMFHLENLLKSLVSTNSTIAAAIMVCLIKRVQSYENESK